MSAFPVSLLSGTIRVPDLGPMPTGHTSALSTVGGVVAIAGTVLLVLAVLGSPQLVSRGRSPWIPFLAALTTIAVGLGLFWVTSEADKQRDDLAHAQYAQTERLAQDQAAAGLKDAYGVVIGKAYYIPTQPDTYWPVEMTLPNRSVEECLIGTYDHIYTIRCGGDGIWADATPLSTLDVAAATP